MVTISASRRARAALSRSLAAAVALRCVTASTVEAAGRWSGCLRRNRFIGERKLSRPGSDAEAGLLALARLEYLEAAGDERVSGGCHRLEADQVLAGRREDLREVVALVEAHLDPPAATSQDEGVWGEAGVSVVEGAVAERARLD